MHAYCINYISEQSLYTVQIPSQIQCIPAHSGRCVHAKDTAKSRNDSCSWAHLWCQLSPVCDAADGPAFRLPSAELASARFDRDAVGFLFMEFCFR